MKANPNNTTKSPNLVNYIVIVYVILVLALDILSSLRVIDNSLLKFPLQRIIPKSFETKYFTLLNIISHFDILKFTLWLVMPAFIFRKQIDLSWFKISTLGRTDLTLLIVFALICVSSLSAIFIFPSLSNYYSGIGSLPPQAKIIFTLRQIVWLISWLPGWEFLNRHLLLRASENIYTNKGWLLVPVVETSYHLIKPLPEAMGMFIFSFIATIYTVKRKNNIPAFLCHLLIELGLIIILISF